MVCSCSYSCFPCLLYRKFQNNDFSIMWLVVWKQTVVIVKGESLEELSPGENFSSDKHRSVGPCCDTCTVSCMCVTVHFILPPLPSAPLSPLPSFLRVAASPHLDSNQQICVSLLISAQARNPASLRGSRQRNQSISLP